MTLQPIKWWWPQASPSVIRLLPAASDAANWSKHVATVWVHRLQLPHRTIYTPCLTHRHASCRLCDLARQHACLQHHVLWSQFNCRMRSVSNIVVVDDPSNPDNNHQVRGYVHNHSWREHDYSCILGGADITLTWIDDLRGWQADVDECTTPNHNGSVLGQVYSLDQLSKLDELDAHELDAYVTAILMSHG